VVWRQPITFGTGWWRTPRLSSATDTRVAWSIRVGTTGVGEARTVERTSTIRAAQRPGLTTGRLTVVVIIAAALLLTLALPLREFLNQRSLISDLEVSAAAARERVEQLQKEADAWADDNYAMAQARERFHLQYPGETGYVVTDPPQSQADPEPLLQNVVDNSAWYERALRSMQDAQEQPDESVVAVRPDAPR
jgi:cell division protein FtsB